ncbi:MaoC family dehydratase N-terminal domain-containing protein [Frankia sp. AgB1.9]|nr:MaoC family dehydratase N-terminal domain-containing protein [Frankia sp. AgW1.1]MBL7551081.1 MaoC family dehydratase N-terminal domain-containing protein [Frankia sp. AgB1.9]
MLVELGKIREFARATGSSHEEYLRTEPDVVSPVTFLMSAAFWQAQVPGSSPYDEVEPLDMSRMLHGAQDFSFPDGPPVAGTRLVGRSRFGRTYAKQGRRGGEMTFTEVVTEYRDETGRLVAEVTGTSIATSRPAGA